MINKWVLYQVKSCYCTAFSFIDEELPSQYYKDLCYDFRIQTKMCNMKAGTVDDEDDSRMKFLKAMEELNVEKTKLNFWDKVYYVLFGVVAMVSIVIAVIVMY